MAEANKCDVVGCGVFSEGSPEGRFTASGKSYGMCKKHSDALILSYFPETEKPVEVTEPSAPSTPQTT